MEAARVSSQKSFFAAEHCFRDTVCLQRWLAKQPTPSQIAALVFATIPYTMPFFKEASEDRELWSIMLTVVLSQRHFGRGAPNDYFSTKVCELGLHFGTKSSCSSNAQIL